MSSVLVKDSILRYHGYRSLGLSTNRATRYVWNPVGDAISQLRGQQRLSIPCHANILLRGVEVR